MPETSIIIRCFNEEVHLPALFDALEKQTYRDYETVIVDSGSYDHSREIARQRADRLVEIEPNDFTFGYSLNMGLRHSLGHFIAIISAHARPVDEHWLSALTKPLVDEEVGMVYGKQVGTAESKFSEACDFERTFGSERQVLTPPEFFANNANAAFRRDLWQLHPFDEVLPGLEDIEWARFWMERGRCVVYEPMACVYHIHRESWPQVRRRYYREAVAAKWLGLRGPSSVLAEVWKEGTRVFNDLQQAGRQKQMITKGPEIGRFRIEKLLGTTKGLCDGAIMRNPMTREKLLFNRQFKAVVIKGPGQAELQSVELKPLKPSDVLVRVAYEGVCMTDLEILDGELGYYKNGIAKYPITPGHEFSGTVAAVGARVSNVREGDRVVVECIQSCGDCDACRRGNAIGCAKRREVGVIGRDGGYADYMLTPSRFIHVLPPTADLRAACLCEPLAVVLKGLRRLERAWGSTPGTRACAVVGAGPIGHLTARLLAHRGHAVTVFDRDQRRFRYLLGSGVSTCQDLGELRLFDTVVEATGDPDALHVILHHSPPGCALLLIGLPYAHRTFTFETIVAYDKTIVGSVGSSCLEFKEAVDTLAQVDTSPFMERILPLTEYEQAWNLARAREHLKVILQVDLSVRGNS